MADIPSHILEKIRKREKLRKQDDFQGADVIRDEILNAGYDVIDTPNGSTDIHKKGEKITPLNNKIGDIVVFGSGELSTVGRTIHEQTIQSMTPPVHISLLETPAGYEDNPHHWYLKLKANMELGLINFHPIITLIPALRSDGRESTNNPEVLAPLNTADYIHTGAGSPSYALKHLKDSLAYTLLHKRLLDGTPLSIASAAAVAFGKYTLPVYELYFAGHDPMWLEGLDFFGFFGLNITFIPHWNNKEGGKDIDTRFCYMGEKRWNTLLSIIPGPTTFIGIDEHTALVFNVTDKHVIVKGKGSATIINNGKTTVVKSGDVFTFEDLHYLYTP